MTSAVEAGAYCVGIGDAELIKHEAQTAIPDFSKVKVINDSIIVLDDDHKLILNNAPITID